MPAGAFYAVYFIHSRLLRVTPKLDWGIVDVSHYFFFPVS